jgi:transposase
MRVYRGTIMTQNAQFVKVYSSKISGGRRTWTGAEIFEVVLSVYETAKKRGQRFMGMLKKKLEMPPSGKSLNTSTS